MYFTAILAFAAGTALAVPARFMPVAAEEWTIENMSRTCDSADTKCTWTFSINTNTDGVDPTDVEYIVEASGGIPASRAIGGPSEHGVFTVTSTWTDTFGLPEAWTTLSVIDYERGILVHPAYKDVLLEGGAIVEPDQTYVPEAIS